MAKQGVKRQGRQPGEDAVVVLLDDIDPAFVEFCGDCGERAGPVLRRNP